MDEPDFRIPAPRKEDGGLDPVEEEDGPAGPEPEDQQGQSEAERDGNLAPPVFIPDEDHGPEQDCSAVDADDLCPARRTVPSVGRDTDEFEVEVLRGVLDKAPDERFCAAFLGAKEVHGIEKDDLDAGSLRSRLASTMTCRRRSNT